MRISSQPIATLLVNELGRPLTATSANPPAKNRPDSSRGKDIFCRPGRIMMVEH